MTRTSRSIEALQTHVGSWIAARNTLPMSARSVLPEAITPGLSPEERETIGHAAQALGYKRAFRRLFMAAGAD